MQQRFVGKASHISVMRDERHGRLAMRFVAVAPDLTTRSGFLGQARQAGAGADNVSLATWAVMKRFCSRFHSAPGLQKLGRLKANLFRHLRSRVVSLCADAAANEMASCEISRSARLSLNAGDIQPNAWLLRPNFCPAASARCRGETSIPISRGKKIAAAQIPFPTT